MGAGIWLGAVLHRLRYTAGNHAPRLRGAAAMTDIVERLRDYINHDEDEWLEYMLEAAAEIERLRQEGTVEVARLLMENERLRAALEAYACPGLGQCREPRLDDGSCLIDATGGRCGDEARRALEPKP